MFGILVRFDCWYSLVFCYVGENFMWVLEFLWKFLVVMEWFNDVFLFFLVVKLCVGKFDFCGEGVGYVKCVFLNMEEGIVGYKVCVFYV